MSRREIARCRDRNPTPQVASEAAPSLVGLGNGLQPDDRIIGRGPIWVLDEAVRSTPGVDVVEGGWRTKFPWFRTKAGHLRASGRLVNGTEEFKISFHESSYPEIGFMPSTMQFFRGGCWKVTAQLRRTTIHFFMAFSSDLEALCRDLDWQLANIAGLRARTPDGYVWPPENDRQRARLREAWYGSGCDR
jgi:hypothetical protein